MGKKCVHCGLDNAITRNFCIDCGKSLSERNNAPVEKKTEKDISQMKQDKKCKYCGSYNRPLQKFCGSCGKPLSKRNDKKEDKHTSDEVRKKSGLGTFFKVIFAIIIMILLFLILAATVLNLTATQLSKNSVSREATCGIYRSDCYRNCDQAWVRYLCEQKCDKAYAQCMGRV